MIIENPAVHIDSIRYMISFMNHIPYIYKDNVMKTVREEGKRKLYIFFML